MVTLGHYSCVTREGVLGSSSLRNERMASYEVYWVQETHHGIVSENRNPMLGTCTHVTTFLVLHGVSSRVVPV